MVGCAGTAFCSDFEIGLSIGLIQTGGSSECV